MHACRLQILNILNNIHTLNNNVHYDVLTVTKIMSIISAGVITAFFRMEIAKKKTGNKTTIARNIVILFHLDANTHLKVLILGRVH